MKVCLKLPAKTISTELLVIDCALVLRGEFHFKFSEYWYCSKLSSHVKGGTRLELQK